jgi:maleylacetoacetate isomerase/maleylpyruvate isomerase
MGTSEERVLHNYWRSSCSWRVRMALHHKGLAYTYKAVNLLKGEDTEPTYFAMNPAGVPTLVDEGGVVITQSLAIIEYLEERYPDHPLLPRGFADRAKVRAVALLIASGVQPLQNLAAQQKVAALAGPEVKTQWTKEVISEGLHAIELLLQGTAGTFCFGDELSMADLCLVPQVYAAKRFGVELTIDALPTLTRVHGNLEGLSVVRETHPDMMPDAVKA